MTLVHTPTFRLNSILFVVFLALAVGLWMGMPDRYPVHFRLLGEPTRWTEDGPGMWILLVALCTISFGKLHLFQRFLFHDPDSTLLNVPYKRLFQKLPTPRKVPVARRVNRMLGLANTGLLLTYSFVLLLVYYSAHNPDSGAARAANYSLLVVVVFMLVFPLVELVALRRMVRRKLEEEGLFAAP